MKVILQQDMQGLGQAGQTVDVADGYAMNFLLPHQVAVAAHGGHEKMVAENMRQAAQKQARIKQEAIDKAQRMKQQRFALGVKTGEKGKMFGNITSLQIAKLISEKMKDLSLTHDQVTLKAPITALGVHTVVVRLHPDVHTEIEIAVEAV